VQNPGKIQGFCIITGIGLAMPDGYCGLTGDATSPVLRVSCRGNRWLAANRYSAAVFGMIRKKAVFLMAGSDGDLPRF
jgi:hypothetical protein